MNNKKAFTLIELLAVIIILGLLMAIAIPSISKYIEQSRKKTYINSAQSYVDSVSKEISSGNIRLDDETASYYIPFSCIPLERGGKSPNGDWDFGYVGISINNGKGKYYIYSKDVKGMGIPSLEMNNIKYTNVKTITTGKDDLVALEGKSNLLVVPDTCDYNNLIVKEGVPFGDVPTDSCFNITSDGEVTTNFPGEYKWEVVDDVRSYYYLSPYKDSSCYTENLVIPNTINGITVTSIGAVGFGGHELQSISIPSSVTHIGEVAFGLNQLTSVNIPNSVTSIGLGAFGMNQLTSVTIPNGVTILEDAVFWDNQLTSVVIPNSVTSIGEWAFQHNQLSTVAIPNSVTTIESYAFYDNQLTSVVIPNSVTTIGYAAFRHNQLTSVVIPNSVTTIEGYTFYNNPLGTITLLGRSSTTEMNLGSYWKGSGTVVYVP